MRSSVDLSVVIVNWNTRELVLQCLEFLYRTTEGLPMEVFVVDNGSHDGSVEAIRNDFPGVILVENEENLGFARANNKALRRARGKYSLLLNTDTILQDGTVMALLKFMEETPKAAIGGAQLLNPDGSKQNSVDNFPTLWSEGLNKSLLRLVFPRRFPSKRRSLSRPIEVESVIGACAVVRKKAVEEVGFMDEDYFLFMEETDWCYRMRTKGWKVYLIPHAAAIHLQGSTAARVKARAKVEYYRSRYLFFQKHRGAFQAGALAGVLFIKLTISLLMHGLVCLLTAFQSRRAWQRLSVTWQLLAWHARFCPQRGGLRA